MSSMEIPGKLDSKKNAFEEQFERREKVPVSRFGTAEVVDIPPRHPSDKLPILFSPAFACTLPVYKPSLRVLSQETNRRVLSLEHPRIGGDTSLENDSFDPEGRKAVRELSSKGAGEQVRQALTLLKVLEARQEKKWDCIGHSQGGADALIAALLRPDLFETVFLFAPVGLIGNDDKWRLLKEFGNQGTDKPSLDAIPVSEEDRERAQKEGRTISEYKEIRPTEEARDVPAIAEKEAPKYIGKNPVRAINEWLGMSKLDMVHTLRILKSKGVNVIVMSGVDDNVYDTKTMGKTISREKREGEDIEALLGGFLSVRGGHGQIGDNPEIYAAAAEQLLSASHRKKLARAGTSVE